MGLDPAEPSSGGTKWYMRHFYLKRWQFMHFQKIYQYCRLLLRYNTHVLSSTGKVDGDPPPVFVLGRGINGTLSITGAANGWGHTLWGDERPAMTAVCGVLQSHTMGERGGLTTAHTQLKLQEWRAWYLKVPALCIPRLFCRYREKLNVTLAGIYQNLILIRLNNIDFYVSG